MPIVDALKALGNDRRLQGEVKMTLVDGRVVYRV